METNAKIALWEDKIAVGLDDHCYETLLAGQTGGRVRIELEVCGHSLMVGVTPDPTGPATLVRNTNGEVATPWRAALAASHFIGDVAERLTRFGALKFELTGTRSGLSGEIDLVPHLRPWPKLRSCKAYDLGTRAVEVYKERMLSCAVAGDVWSVPPRDFMDKCPKSFMTIWGEMPTGLELRMEGGHVHRR